MVRPAWFAFLCCVALGSSRGSDRPNFVFFVADDLGIGDVGCFGNDTIRTPHIDRIAAKGAKLTQHLAAAAVCTPSRSAFLTGRYPIRYGMVGTDLPLAFVQLAIPSGLPRSEVTFPQLAKAHGYRTALLGKWHLGLNCAWAGDHCHHPSNFGFDYFYGLPLTNGLDCDPDVTVTVGQYIAMLLYRHLRLWEISTTIFVAILALKYFRYIQWKTVFLLSVFGWSLVAYPHLALTNGRRLNCVIMRDDEIIEMPFNVSTITPRMTLEAVRFLEESKKEPFLLEVSYWNVHTAQLPYMEFRGRSRHGLYGDAVEEMDWSVGVVMATLERLGLTENTFVYFTSDNGGHIETGVEGGSNGIYKGGKGQGGSEGGIRMPTLVQWPRKIKPGTVVSEATSQMDIFPTVADILGTPLPQDKVIDGRNIMPLLGGAAVTSPHDVLFHYCSEYLHAVRYRPREGNVTWKAHFVSYNWDPGTTGCYSLRICRCAGQEVTYNDPPLLYDVTNDPGEDRPISDPRYPVVMGVINKAVEEHVRSLTEEEKQIGLSNFIPRPWLQECCNFPFCDCKEDVDLSSLEIGGQS
ncbi:PREDICTED: arylsulfatase H-like [Branchiostoma belcheri]|uniref:Arylsulfatase H-like n=1 Tax=Branchiostoma belcheri TaxID=7741 RepID=A0A6P4ZBT9_BRABE|nr:PREDICTED: arylsulfatase H-like [Branchiostoma belcheri]